MNIVDRLFFAHPAAIAGVSPDRVQEVEGNTWDGAELNVKVDGKWYKFRNTKSGWFAVNGFPPQLVEAKNE